MGNMQAYRSARSAHRLFDTKKMVFNDARTLKLHTDKNLFVMEIERKNGWKAFNVIMNTVAIATFNSQIVHLPLPMEYIDL